MLVKLEKTTDDALSLPSDLIAYFSCVGIYYSAVGFFP